MNTKLKPQQIIDQINANPFFVDAGPGRVDFSEERRDRVWRGIGLAHAVKCCAPKVYSVAVFTANDDA